MITAFNNFVIFVSTGSLAQKHEYPTLRSGFILRQFKGVLIPFLQTATKSGKSIFGGFANA